MYRFSCSHRSVVFFLFLLVLLSCCLVVEEGRRSYVLASKVRVGVHQTRKLTKKTPPQKINSTLSRRNRKKISFYKVTATFSFLSPTKMTDEYDPEVNVMPMIAAIRCFGQHVTEPVGKAKPGDYRITFGRLMVCCADGMHMDSLNGTLKRVSILFHFVYLCCSGFVTIASTECFATCWIGCWKVQWLAVPGRQKVDLVQR